MWFLGKLKIFVKDRTVAERVVDQPVSLLITDLRFS
jgi:hypothetical protein